MVQTRAEKDEACAYQLDHRIAMDDARWVLNFLRGIEEEGRHAPTETMQRLIDAIEKMQVVPRIVIGLEGGLIQGATANVPIEYIEHGSELDTEICFAVGELDRDSLEETAANIEVNFDKYTSDDVLRARIIEAARSNGGIQIFDDEGELLRAITISRRSENESNR